MKTRIICPLSSTKNNIFRFKQFSVDQDGCAMKVNTDGVLLGALAAKQDPGTILDIGTGTGVIALMLAQRFPEAYIDAVEIDAQAAHAAAHNFNSSAFAKRLNVSPYSFQEFSVCYPDKKYDLIISNPPFFIDSLKNPDKQKQTARHAGKDFFAELVAFAGRHLNVSGTFSLILPPETSALLKKYAGENNLHLKESVSICSFAASTAHREMLSFSTGKQEHSSSVFVIYKAERQYSEQYVDALRDFFTIF